MNVIKRFVDCQRNCIKTARTLSTKECQPPKLVSETLCFTQGCLNNFSGASQMNTVRIVLATESKELAENVTHVVQRINGCRLDTVSLSQVTAGSESSDINAVIRRASLVLLHQSDLSEESMIAGLLKSINSVGGKCLVI